MYLTKTEERMLEGEYGGAVSLSMKILTRIGDAFDANRMVKVDSAHLVASSYSYHESGVDIVERFASSGGRFGVPTTSSPLSVELGRLDEFRIPKEYAEEQMKIIRAHMKMGVAPTWCCTPYLCGNIPRLRQHVSWGEAPAVAYVNSVLGARTNRETVGVEISSSIAGRTPNYGLHLDENRKGEILVKVQAKPLSDLDYKTISYLVGQIVGDKIPVYVGMPQDVSTDQLKYLGSASSSPGAVPLFHVVGVTREARSVEEAFQNDKPNDKIVIDRNTIAEAEQDLSCPSGEKVDVVSVGCPFCSLSEVGNIAKQLEGRRVRGNAQFWVHTSSQVKQLADQMGYCDIIETAGGRVTATTCVLISPMIEIWKFQNLMTDSSILAGLIPVSHKVGLTYRSMEECVKEVTEKGG